MKSVFISSTFKDMQAERDYLHEKIFPKIRKMTILYFSGNPGCQSVHTLKNVLIYRLEEILGKEQLGDVENKNECLRELGGEMKGRKIFLFVDALDQLLAQNKLEPLEILGFCPELLVVTSSLEDFPYENALMYGRNIQVIEIGRFLKQDKQQLIQRTCEYRGTCQRFGKEQTVSDLLHLYEMVQRKAIKRIEESYYWKLIKRENFLRSFPFF